MSDAPERVWIAVEAAQMTEHEHVAKIMEKMYGEPSVLYVPAARYDEAIELLKDMALDIEYYAEAEGEANTSESLLKANAIIAKATEGKAAVEPTLAEVVGEARAILSKANEGK